MFDHGGHRGDRVFKRQVLPDTHDSPTRAHQSFIGCLVTLDVAAQLRRPVPLVRRRLPAVLRANVPEAPVDENGDFLGRENDVWADPHPFGQVEAEVLPVAISEAVQRAAQRDFRFRVGPPVRAHVARPPRARSSRVQAFGVCALAGVSAVT